MANTYVNFQANIVRYDAPVAHPSHHIIHPGGGYTNYYACPLPTCGYRTPRSDDLVVHTRTHTGARPYPCPEPACGKAFATASHLGEHIRGVHEGARPHACDVPGCGYAATTAGNLTKHRKTHFSHKEHVCTIGACRQTFARASDLTVHRAGHA